MSDTVQSLRRKITSASDLQSVVRVMKAAAAVSIGQYESAVSALGDYFRTVELGLGACFRDRTGPPIAATERVRPATINAVVFGSDQGLVGPFNDVVADHAVVALAARAGPSSSASAPVRPAVWAVGERVHARLADAGVDLIGSFPVPSSVAAIAPLVGQILVETDAHHALDEVAELHLVYNRPAVAAVYTPTSQRLLPLDATWRRDLAELAWPTKIQPEIVGDGSVTLRALVREYLFVSLFRACAESLASENASRLAAMQRADKNIDGLLSDLGARVHRKRQGKIDEELFDVIAGAEMLASGA